MMHYVFLNHLMHKPKWAIGETRLRENEDVLAGEIDVLKWTPEPHLYQVILEGKNVKLAGRVWAWQERNCRLYTADVIEAVIDIVPPYMLDKVGSGIAEIRAMAIGHSSSASLKEARAGVAPFLHDFRAPSGDVADAVRAGLGNDWWMGLAKAAHRARTARALYVANAAYSAAEEALFPPQGNRYHESVLDEIWVSAKKATYKAELFGQAEKLRQMLR